MLAFFIVVCAIWVSLHAYVGRRVVRPLGRRWLRLVLYVLLTLLALASPLVFFVGRLLLEHYAEAYRWIAWVYIGGFSTLFALVVVRDLMFFLGTRIARARRAPERRPPSPERRQFLLNASSGAAATLTTGLTYWGFEVAQRPPEVVEVEVPIPGLPPALDGYHIVQLSDIHVGETVRKELIIPIIEQVSTLAPDLVVLTGDLVDGSVPELQADVSPFGYLRARDGVLVVTGNHEYYSGAEAWCEHFRGLGLTVLNNEHVLIQRSDARMLVAGVTDYSAARILPSHASDPAAALRGAPAHDVRILLAHQPRSAKEAAKHGFKLQLSGHTHGGQFFPWNLLVGLVQPIGKGLGEVDGMPVYVNRGTCYWGPPNRAGVPAEITSLRLRSART